MREQRLHQPGAVPLGGPSARNLRLKPGRLYTEIREPYFFGYVRDQLIKHYGSRDGALGRPKRLYDDRARAGSERRRTRSARRSTGPTILPRR